jgi:hypothetical protein
MLRGLDFTFYMRKIWFFSDTNRFTYSKWSSRIARERKFCHAGAKNVRVRPSFTRDHMDYNLGYPQLQRKTTQGTGDLEQVEHNVGSTVNNTSYGHNAFISVQRCPVSDIYAGRPSLNPASPTLLFRAPCSSFCTTSSPGLGQG